MPIHKTTLHADTCSGCYQNRILVCLIIVRCVSSLGLPEFRCLRNSSGPNGAGIVGNLRGLPIHKTSVHADVCSGCYQNVLLVWLIIVRCVSSLGSSGVSRLEEFLGSERCADSWESLSLLAHELLERLLFPNSQLTAGRFISAW